MAAALFIVLVAVLAFLPSGLSSGVKGTKFREVLSSDPRINWLSAARTFLFGARDVWFVVALPIWLSTTLAEPGAERAAFLATGSFMAVWIIGYGAVQAGTPRLLGQGSVGKAMLWAGLLTATAALTAAAHVAAPDLAWPVIVGLLAFGAAFAVNSALHSYLILAFAGAKRVTMDVGFYYMANAAGRLMGTVLSGLCYQFGGLTLSLSVSAVMVVISALALTRIPEASAPA
jgi:hypothetical protein